MEQPDPTPTRRIALASLPTLEKPKRDKSPKIVKIAKTDAPKSPKEDKGKKDKEKKIGKVTSKKEDKEEKTGKEKNKDKTGKEKDKKDAPKSPKDKSDDAKSDHSHRAPFELVQAVKKFGRDPLCRFLLSRLEAFQKSKEYKHYGEKWDVIDWDKLDIPEDDRSLYTATELANVTPRKLYEKFMFGETFGNRDGANHFMKFLRKDYFDSFSWECLCDFEIMMKERTSYTTFMSLFNKVMKIISDEDDPFGKGNKEEVEALKGLLGDYWDSASKAPRELSKKEKNQSEKMWMEEMVRTEKVAREEMEQLRIDNKCAPPLLLKYVKEFGRDPLYLYLLTKLDLFKKSDEYRVGARKWDLIKVADKDFLDEEDLINITAQELYEKLMFGKSDGNFSATDEFVSSFLRRKHSDSYSWACIRNFETMMNETTTYVDFMKLFEKNMVMIGEDSYPFSKKNPDDVAALQQCFAKYKNLDLARARKQK